MGIFNFRKSNNSTGPSISNKAAEVQERLEQYRRAWEAYKAELPDPLIVGRDEPNDNVKVSPARALVNASVYFLFGKTPEFVISPDAVDHYGTGGSLKEDNPDGYYNHNPDWLRALNRCWKANRKDSLLLNLGLSGGIHGTVFLKIVPNATGIRNEFPRLVLLDPANVDVETDPNDCDRVLVYTIEYIVDGDEDGTPPKLLTQEIRANQDEYGVTQNWSIQDFEHEMTWVSGSGYVPLMGGRTPVSAPVLWEYPWPPIEHCQNIEIPHEFWGLPDLDPAAVDVIEALQRAMSSLNKVVRVHGSPRMFAKNVMPDQVGDIDISPDNIITLPNMEADLGVLQTMSNLAPSIQFTDKIREDLYEMLQVPPIALGKFETASTSISGVTLSIMYAPLLQKTDMKRTSYGDMLERLNHKLLELMGFTEHEEHEGLIVEWPEAMPGSAYLQRQTFETDKQLGVSSHTIVSALGYDPKEEQERALAEREAQLELESRYAVKPEPTEETRGGNNNPSGYGNKNGSMGGTKSAGVPKTPSDDK